MKKYILSILLIIAVIFISGCITNSDNTNANTNDTSPKTLAKEGILIKYPGTWVVASSQSNDSIVALADPKSKDPVTKLNNVNVNIERRNLSSSLDSYFNQTYKSLFSNSDFTPIAQGSTFVGQYTALECSYFQNSNGTVKQHRALWIEHNNQVYVILCTAPKDDFQNQVKNFDFILSNFRIT